MIRSRYIDQIVGLVLAAALLLTGFLYYIKSEETVSASGSLVEMPYETSVFDKTKVTEIDIQVEPEDWEELLENAVKEEYISCDISINGKLCKNVGIRCKGNTSLSQVASSDSDRYSFKVKFDEYVKDQTFDGLNKLALNNTFCDATYMKEYLSYDLMASLEMAAPLYAFAHITVNGEEWGLYLAVECLEESFAERNFGGDYGALYKVEGDNGGGGMEQPSGERMEGQEPGEAPMDGTLPETEQPEDFREDQERTDFQNPEEGFGQMAEGGWRQGQHMDDGAKEGQPGGRNGGSGGTDLVYTDDEFDSYSGILENASYEVTDEQKSSLIQAIKELNEGENLEACVNLEQNLKYFAANTFLVNDDDYLSNLTHNIYLYEKDGVLSVIPWDYNLAFGGFQRGSAQSAINAPIDTPGNGMDLSERPLLGKMLEQEEYLEQYHAYLEQIVEGYVLNGTFENTIDSLVTLIGDYVKEDATAFYSYEEFLQAVENLKEFGQLRALSVQGQLDGTIPSTTQGQQEDSSALISAEGVDLTAMGTQEGGMDGEAMDGMRKGERTPFGQNQPMEDEKRGTPAVAN